MINERNSLLSILNKLKNEKKYKNKIERRSLVNNVYIGSCILDETINLPTIENEQIKIIPNGIFFDIHKPTRRLRHKINIIGEEGINNLNFIFDKTFCSFEWIPYIDDIKIYFKCPKLYGCENFNKTCNCRIDFEEFLNRLKIFMNENNIKCKNLINLINRFENQINFKKLDYDKKNLIKKRIYSICNNKNCYYNNNPFKINIRYNNNLISCPNKDCFMNINGEKTLNIYCNLCNHYHKDDKCIIKDNWEYLDDSLKIDLQKLINKNKLQKCPNCKITIAKDNACDKVICPNKLCNQKFCYTCGGKINNKVDYITDHLMVSPCKTNYGCRITYLKRAIKNENGMRLFIENSLNFKPLQNTILEMINDKKFELDKEYLYYLKNKIDSIK